MNNEPSNFNRGKENIEKKAPIDEVSGEEIEKQEELEEANNAKIEQEAFRAKMVKMFGFVIVGLIVVLCVGFLISLLTKKNYSHADTEDKMKDAAISYFTDNKSRLPKTAEETVEITASVLAENKYMKTLDKYLKNETCSGKVVVKKSSSKDYSFTSYLDCGSDYKTTEFYKALTDKKNIVTEGYGLYYYNNQYTFKGEKVNNYVKFSDSDIVWRAVKIINSNEVVLISEDSTINSYVWDERYNTKTEGTDGVNTFKNSKISGILNLIYKNAIDSTSEDSIYDTEIEFLTSADKTKLVKFNDCVAARSENDTSKDGATECSIINETKLSLLPAYYFMDASLDSNCTTATSPSCQNYNYLANGNNFWLLTGYTEDDSKVYSVSENYIYQKSASSDNRIRVVIHVGDDTMLEEGKGTAKNPYIIR